MYKKQKTKKKSLSSRSWSKKRLLITSIAVFLLVFGTIGVYALSQKDNNEDTQPQVESEMVEEEPDVDTTDNQEDKPEETDADESPVEEPAPAETSTQESSGVSLLTIVNKRTPISPLSYAPPSLVSPSVTKRAGAVMDPRASQALESLFAGAKDAGYTLMLSNGFRSYATQQSLYNSYVAQDGQAAADTYSARPGHSEHQTGLAADIIVPSGACSLEQCFGDLPEGKWLAENAHTYGFIIRYTPTNEAEAGYTYEPWHIRYIGVSEAKKYVSEGASSLETFLGKPPAPDYL